MPKRRSRRSAASTDVVRVGLAIAGALCAGTLLAATPQATTVHMRGQGFAPAKLDVAAGATVTWINDDTMPHSVTANDKRFDSGALAPGKSFTWTADKPGEVAYHCIFHPSMTGSVVVTAGAR
jgi:plastocyanin